MSIFYKDAKTVNKLHLNENVPTFLIKYCDGERFLSIFCAKIGLSEQPNTFF